MQEPRRRHHEEDDRRGRGRWSSERTGDDMRYVPDYEDFRYRRGGQRQEMGRYGPEVERSWRDQGDGGYSSPERWREDEGRRYGSSMSERESDYGEGGYGSRGYERGGYQPFDPEEGPRGFERSGAHGRGRDWGYSGGWGMGGSRPGGMSGGFEGAAGSSGRYEREVANPWNRGMGRSTGASGYREHDRELDRWYGEGGSPSGARYGREPGTWMQGGASYAGRGPKDYRRSDDRIREEISDRLTDDDRIDASEISVSVKNGEVTLSGTVGDREQKRRAEDLAERISGVSEVTNNIRLTRGNGDARAHDGESGSPRSGASGSGSSSSGQSSHSSQGGMSSTGKPKSTQTP